MPAFDQLLATIIARATAEVADAVRANMAAEIAHAMKARGAADRATRRKAGRPAGKSAPKPAKPRTAKRTPPKARRGARVVIDAGHAAQVLGLLEKSPGLRAEEITQRLGGKAVEVKAVLAALRATGRVMVTGRAGVRSIECDSASAKQPKREHNDDGAAMGLFEFLEDPPHELFLKLSQQVTARAVASQQNLANQPEASP